VTGGVYRSGPPSAICLTHLDVCRRWSGILQRCGFPGQRLYLLALHALTGPSRKRRCWKRNFPPTRPTGCEPACSSHSFGERMFSMKQCKPVTVPSAALRFCRYGVAAIVWIGYIWYIPELIVLSFISWPCRLLRIKRAPMIYLYTNTVERLFPSAPVGPGRTHPCALPTPWGR